VGYHFIAKKLNQIIKAAPTNMDENSSPGSGTLNQITIRRWRLSFIKGRLHRLAAHQSLKEALGLVQLYPSLGYFFAYAI
jgi:hypothetical protein